MAYVKALLQVDDLGFVLAQVFGLEKDAETRWFDCNDVWLIDLFVLSDILPRFTLVRERSFV